MLLCKLDAFLRCIKQVIRGKLIDLPGWLGSISRNRPMVTPCEVTNSLPPIAVPLQGSEKNRQGLERWLDLKCQRVEGKATMTWADGVQGSAKAGRYLVLPWKGCWVPSSLSCDSSQKLELCWRSHVEPASVQHRRELCCMFHFSVLVRQMQQHPLVLHLHKRKIWQCCYTAIIPDNFTFLRYGLGSLSL